MLTISQAHEAPTRKPHHLFWRWISCYWALSLLLAVFSPGLRVQAAELAAQNQATPAPPTVQDAASTATPVQDAKPAKPVRNSDRRRAAKLYLASSKLFVNEQFEEAMRGYERAAQLDPGNADYPLAASVARGHATTARIQAAAKDRLRGDREGARANLARALELDPGNTQVNEHLYELGDDALLGQTKPIYEQEAERAGGGVELAPTAGVHSFHLHTDQRQIIRQVFKAYGIDATVDSSVRGGLTRLDVDNVNFETATRIVDMLTASFSIALDPHRALVARDTKENRQQFQRLEMETIYLSGLTATELTEVANLAKNAFNMHQAVAEPTAGTITLRAPQKTLNAFNATMGQLFDGRSQVLLDVCLIQLAHSSGRDTGVQLPQSISAYNLYSEEQSILTTNATAVQEIISSGLASADDPLAILGILIAAGDVSSSLFSSGIAVFGGGITQSALSPGTVTANFNLNSSDSRELDNVQLRLGDGEEGLIRLGERYPIQTSSYSSLSTSGSSLAGLTAAGSSSALSALLASYSSSTSTVPQVEYQDLGLVLHATPKVMRNDKVALTIEMKIDALSGSTLNDNPVLNNRAYSGVVTLKQGEAVAVISMLSKSESRAISGTPGLSEIPGLNSLTGKDTEKNYATLLILMRPHVIRGTQAGGHSPMLRVDRGQ